MTEQPDFVTDYQLGEMLAYLDQLRESGVVNMWGAASFLRREFSWLTRNQAASVLLYWMKTFSERHP